FINRISGLLRFAIAASLAVERIINGEAHYITASYLAGRRFCRRGVAVRIFSARPRIAADLTRLRDRASEAKSERQRLGTGWPRQLSGEYHRLQRLPYTSQLGRRGQSLPWTARAD